MENRFRISTLSLVSFLVIGLSILAQESSNKKDLYLNDGVEFVFPTGVHYILANVYAGLWPVETTNIEHVLESDDKKLVVNFATVVNTLKLANFSIQSTIYTDEEKKVNVPLSILGTEVKRSSEANRDIEKITNGNIKNFMSSSLYGDAKTSYTVGSIVNTINYENEWAWPWKSVGEREFSDSKKVQFLEAEGLMPYYENEAFAAVAALFKGGTGSVVFLKPKQNVTILQLMLNPTVLTRIFDEHFPGWGVKKMVLRVPQTKVQTSSQHFESLVKRGVSDSFCNYDAIQKKRAEHPYFLNPVVQTNHICIDDKKFALHSVTGATVNSENEYQNWVKSGGQHDEVDIDEFIETTTGATNTQDEEAVTEVNEEEVKQNDSSIKEETPSEGTKSRHDTEKDDSVNEEVVEVTTEAIEETATTKTSENETKEKSDIHTESKTAAAPDQTDDSVEKSGKQGKISSYDFDGPFLWFLHATNDEPLFMGVVESFETYNEVPRWLRDTTRGLLWRCPAFE